MLWDIFGGPVAAGADFGSFTDRCDATSSHAEVVGGSAFASAALSVCLSSVVFPVSADIRRHIVLTIFTCLSVASATFSGISASIEV